jgi:hypothetical protein
MALRLSHLVPDEMIAFFYSGRGVALFICGIRFPSVFARKDVLALAAEQLRANARQPASVRVASRPVRVRER